MFIVEKKSESRRLMSTILVVLLAITGSWGVLLTIHRYVQPKEI
jgi:cytoskeletal protein RodZ